MAARRSRLHDTFVRHFLVAKDIAAELLQRHVDPTLVELLDLDQLICEATTDVDATLAEYIGDLRFSTCFRGSKRRLEVFIFLEHQSTQDEWIGFRLLCYIVRLFERRRAQLGTTKPGEAFPYPVAVVLHHGKKPWKNLPRVPDLIQKVPGVKQDILDFPIHLIDLAVRPASEIEGSPALRALLHALQAAGAGELPQRIEQITSILAEPKQDRRVGEWMSALVHYAAGQCRFADAKTFFTRSFGKIFGAKEAEAMVLTSAQELRREGTAETILVFLEARFHTVPEAVKKAVLAEQKPRKLKSLARLAATCQTLDEFQSNLST